jgi:hypothetical protein
MRKVSREGGKYIILEMNRDRDLGFAMVRKFQGDGGVRVRQENGF